MSRGWSVSYTVLVPTRVHTHQARIMVTESCLQDANLALESHLSGERLSPILMKTTDDHGVKGPEVAPWGIRSTTCDELPFSWEKPSAVTTEEGRIKCCRTCVQFVFRGTEFQHFLIYSPQCRSVRTRFVIHCFKHFKSIETYSPGAVGAVIMWGEGVGTGTRLASSGSDSGVGSQKLSWQFQGPKVLQFCLYLGCRKPQDKITTILKVGKVIFQIPPELYSQRALNSKGDKPSEERQSCQIKLFHGGRASSHNSQLGKNQMKVKYILFF